MMQGRCPVAVARRLGMAMSTKAKLRWERNHAAHGYPSAATFLGRGVPLRIADGYHRVCASYHLSEDAEIPCRIAELPAIAV